MVKVLCCSVMGWGADGTCPVEDIAGHDALKVKGCKMARVPEGGFIGRQLRKLKITYLHILGFLFCAEASQLLRIWGLHTYSMIRGIASAMHDYQSTVTDVRKMCHMYNQYKKCVECFTNAHVPQQHSFMNAQHMRKLMAQGLCLDGLSQLVLML